MDYLKALAVRTGGKVRSQDSFDSNFNQKSFRILQLDIKQYKVEINDFGTLCSLEIKINTKVAFAVNNPDKTLFFKTPIHLNFFPHTVYFSEDSDTKENEEFKRVCISLADLLKKINITSEESVFVARNIIRFAVRTDRDLIQVINSIIDFLLENQDFFKRSVHKTIDVQNIPELLRVLAPLFKKYSIPDDVERQQLTESLSKRKKKELIELVDPFMDQINTYLSSFGEKPLTEGATLIGNLAELVSELKVSSIS